MADLMMDRGLRKTEPPLDQPLAKRLAPTPATPSVPPIQMAGQPLTETVGTLGGQPETAIPTNLPPVAVPATPVPQTALPTNTPPAQIPTQPLAPVPASPGASPVPPSTAPTLTPTDPNNPLTMQTIGAPSALDRVALARDQWQTWVDSTDPAYKAALRDAKRVGAAAGGLGSGQLRTSLGDLGATRANAMDTQGRSFLNDAILGTVDDARFSTGLTERQQGFQRDQQQQAFQNELTRLGFDDTMLNSAFGRALQQWMAGQQGGTGSGTALAGAGSFGAQGSDALEALANLIRAQNAARVPTTALPAPSGQPVNRQGGGLDV